MKMIQPLAAATALAIGMLASPVMAQQVSPRAQFDVLLTIESTCVFRTPDATDINFGAHPSTMTDLRQTGSLSIECTRGTPYEIALDSGENGADVTSRAMSNGAGELVPYQLYQDATLSQVWGETPGTDTREIEEGTGAIQEHTVYGVVPSANFPEGTYSDTVTATVIW